MFDARFDAYARQELERNPVPGLVLAVAGDGQIRHEFTHGMRNVEEGLPATATSRFGIGSITKSFTALALMQLAEAGRLTVEDPVARYLPIRFPGAAQITIHHLLTHSAGLPMFRTEMYATNEYTGKQPLEPMGPRGITAIRTAAELIELLNELEFTPIAPPGAVMSYSNDGFALAGAVVEAVSGRPFTEYVTEHILRPLGLQDTVFGPFDRVGGGTRRYTPKKAEGESPAGFEPGPGDMEVVAMASAGGGPQITTVRDLIRYIELYRNLGVVDGVRLLSEASVRRMTTPYLPVDPGKGYGYGLMVTKLPGGETLIGHGGGDLGVSAWIGFRQERGVSVAAQSNMGSALPERLSLAALRAACGGDPAEAAWEPGPVEASPALLERFLGTYAAAGPRWRIFLEEGALKVQLGEKVYDAVPVEGNALRVQVGPGDSWLIMRAEDGAGKGYGIRAWGRVFAPAGV